MQIDIRGWVVWNPSALAQQVSLFMSLKPSLIPSIILVQMTHQPGEIGMPVLTTTSIMRRNRQIRVRRVWSRKVRIWWVRGAVHPRVSFCTRRAHVVRVMTALDLTQERAVKNWFPGSIFTCPDHRCGIITRVLGKLTLILVWLAFHREWLLLIHSAELPSCHKLNDPDDWLNARRYKSVSNLLPP